MQIQLNTNTNMEGNEALAEQVEIIIKKALDRFSQQITQVEVYLRDQNSSKKFSPNDKRCLIAVRLANCPPVAVSDLALTPQQSVIGATKKMKYLLDNTLGRLHNK